LVHGNRLQAHKVATGSDVSRVADGYSKTCTVLGN